MSNIENGKIALTDIYGVDLFAKTTPMVKAHPALTNPKQTLRDKIISNIISSIENGKVTENDLPPIEVFWSEEDSKWIVVDGYHRLEAIVRYRSKNKSNMLFDKIRAVKFVGTNIKNAQVYAFRVNVQDDETRQGLTDSEIFDFVSKYITDNPNKEAYYYTDKLGVSDKIIKIVSALLSNKTADEVRQAVANGDISLDTASKTVNKGKNKREQAQSVEKIVQGKKQGKNEKEARQEAGVQKKRTSSTRNKQECLEELQDTIDSALQENVPDEDFIYACGKAEGIAFVLNIDQDRFSYIDSEETMRELLTEVNSMLDSTD